MTGGWRETFRSSPMRLTLRLVALFLAVSLITFAATWWLANRALLDAREEALEREIEALSDGRDSAAIVTAVRRVASGADPEELLIRYAGPAGAAGNFTRPRALRPGLSVIDLDGERGDDDFIVLTRMVAGGALSFGRHDESLEDLREVFVKVLSFTLVPTLLLVLAGGVLIARRSGRRLAAIEGALARLTAGDLGARVPETPGPPDDLSRVGAGIDRLAGAQQASLEALRQISADIAHDLKTPIQRLSVQLAEARAALPAGAPTGAMDRAEAEIDGIVATFQALLRIAQIEGGGARARFAPVDLGALAATMAELYEPAAAESGHEIRLERGRPARVEGDRTLLGQMIANLIENALRHTPPGGRIALRVDGGALSVADDGPGIPAEERELVLRRLYRLDRSRTTPGSGLGLSLVDAVVKLHGGRLELGHNAPGLRVLIVLPQV